MTRRRHLALVHQAGMQRLAHRERLIAESQRLFPGNESHAAKWVDAKLALGDKVPQVRMDGVAPTAFKRSADMPMRDWKVKR